MPVDITVPSVGESITEGTLSRWLKKDGDAVRAGDPLFELETEKATTEVPALADGTLRIAVREGEAVRIGGVVGKIEEGAARSAHRQPSPQPSPSPPTGDRAREKSQPTGDRAREKMQPAPPSSPAPPALPLSRLPAGGLGEGRGEGPDRAPTESGSPASSPAAQRLAAESGVDVGTLHGTGRGGRITKEDVQAAIERRPAAPRPDGDGKATPQAAPEARETRQRMTSIRQRIAERLVASKQSTATLTTFNEADLSAVIALRTQYKDRFKEKHGVGLGFMSFFVKATVEALRAFPIVNARLDGSDIVTPHYYNIGVAVSAERGLMVPVLRDADRLSFAQIEKTLAELAQKARDGRITVDDLQGGTFTITNGGVFGSMLSTPILNPPQSAILGMHTIQKRPVAVGEQVVIRPMMYLALSYDHRLIDGRDAVLFLVRVKECIEAPERLLLEI
jgi:2-oxoglutarate dehydrogenase E2 component (dihydrolipoamide succinyltransferase)